MSAAAPAAARKNTAKREREAPPPPRSAFPWPRFASFLESGADRFTLLRTILDEAELTASILSIEGNRHFLVLPRRPRPAPTLFVAHYDRAADSPGANDNSAAVFLLLEAAIREQHTPVYAAGEGGSVFLFTDREELKTGTPITNQGAYSLGLHLKKAGLGDGGIFILDSCGTGEVLVISTAAENLVKGMRGAAYDRVGDASRELQARAREAARRARVGAARLLPTPFSDDVGFLRAGLAAQTLTVLPSSEISDHPPPTWTILNTAKDVQTRLTPEHWEIWLRLIASLSNS